MGNGCFLRDGLILGDCPELSESELKRNLEVAASAVSVSEYTWREDGEPPVISWDSAFEELVTERIKFADEFARRGICLWPWRVFDSLPKERKLGGELVWSQGMIPSCSMHGAAHGFQFMNLVEIAMGAPICYVPLNPIYAFSEARGGDLSGGLTLLEAARQVNERGMYSAVLVGSDNKSVDKHLLEKNRWAAKERQAAIVFLEDDFVERIFRAARAGFFVVFGSGTVYTGAGRDKNGVKVMKGTTRGGHAQCLGAWREVDGTEYVWLQNSHGEIYGKGDEGEPESGAWLDRAGVGVLARDMESYGLPWIPFPEEPSRGGEVMMNEFSARFPKA